MSHISNRTNVLILYTFLFLSQGHDSSIGKLSLWQFLALEDFKSDRKLLDTRIDEMK